MPYSAPGTQGRGRETIRLFERGEGSTATDTEGRTFIDGISALEALILGHGAQDVVDAMTAQAEQLPFLDVFRYAAPVQVDLAAELCELSGMAFAMFTPGGAEADETAIKMARQYHRLRGQPDRMKVITRQGAFHGVTYGAMALDGRYFASRNVIFEGGMSWGRVAPSPACSRCNFGKASRHLACVHNIEALIRAEGPESVAAVVVDPCATAIAVACPPDEYLRDLAEMCLHYGVLLIIDEVITGIGRTGRFLAVEHSGVRPDFITLSKGLSSGYAPIGATLAAAHIAEPFVEGGDQGVFLHGHTYAGHPVAAAAARAVIRRVTDDKLWEQAEALGDRLAAGLRSLSNHRTFWDVRGQGLLVGLEIVADSNTGKDFPDLVAAGNALRLHCRDLGLLSLILHPGNVLFLAPPLTSSETTIDGIVEIVDEALARLAADA